MSKMSKHAGLGVVRRVIRLNLTGVEHEIREGELELLIPAAEWPHAQWEAFMEALLEGMPMTGGQKDEFTDRAGDSVGRLLDIEYVKTLIR